MAEEVSAGRMESIGMTELAESVLAPSAELNMVFAAEAHDSASLNAPKAEIRNKFLALTCMLNSFEIVRLQELFPDLEFLAI